jgi:membrane protein DedA with SNARE-associated domain
MSPALAAIIGVSSSLGYLLPAIIGLESMGVPSPGETALVLAAILASQGKLQIWLVIVIGAASAIVGDNIGYWLGRTVGLRLLLAPGPLHSHRERAVAAGRRFFDRHGPKAVFFGRWIALIRVATAWLAGIDRMHFPVFFFWNALGGITWAITFGLVGYFGGHAAANVLSQVGIVGAIVLGVAIVVGLGYLRWRERRRHSGEAAESVESSDSGEPQAPASEPAPESTTSSAETTDSGRARRS